VGSWESERRRKEKGRRRKVEKGGYVLACETLEALLVPHLLVVGDGLILVRSLLTRLALRVYEGLERHFRISQVETKRSRQEEVVQRERTV